MSHETLQLIWFVLIAVLWIGYFVLEGFDFGVGMLLRVIGKNEAERRAIITTLGPLWDGNEVWLLVAGGGDHRLVSPGGAGRTGATPPRPRDPPRACTG